MQILVFVLALFGFQQQGLAQDLEAVMSQVWQNYTPVGGCEVEQSKITSSNWSKPKLGTRWICYDGDEKSMLFVLNRGKKLRPKTDGVLFIPSNVPLSFKVLVQKRKRIKSKPSGFYSMANGTHFSYFDLARVMGENLDKYSYSLWQNDPSSYLAGQKWKLAIKVIPKVKIEGDYTFRVFYLKYLGGIPAITAVEYFCRKEELCKVQVNDGLHVESNGFWRSSQVQISTIENGKVAGETSLVVTSRKFTDKRLKLNRQALKEGKP